MRKRSIALLAVLLVSALLVSACGSKPAQKDSSAPPAPQAKKEAVFQSAWAYEVPPKGHFNIFSLGNLSFPGGAFPDLMTSPLALYYWHNDSWEKQLATDWKIEDGGKKITVTLRKGAKWSDGTEVKAQDLLTYLWIGRGKDYAIWRYIDKVTAKDDYTIEFGLPQPATIALRYILKSQPQPTSVYGEWATKFQALFEAGKNVKSDEMKALNKEFDAFRPADYVASGPFKMETKSITEAQISLVKRADAWNADKVKIDKIIIFNGETTASTPLVLDKKIDFASHAYPPATEKQILDLGIRVIRFPFYTGPAIFFNHSTYPFNVTEFRQALAYVINRDEAGTVALAKSGVGVKKMAGMADNMVGTWMTPADAAKLNPYALNPAKAEEILKKLNFKKGADGIWLDDKGKKLEFELHVPSDFADWSAGAENVAQQLNKFGIKTSIRGIVWTQYAPELRQGKFQMGFLPWGSSIPNPQFAFLADVVNYNGGGKSGSKEQPGMNYPLVQKYSGGEIDFDKLITEVGLGNDMNKQKEIAGKMAVAFNELLPVIPLFERYANSPTLDGVRVKGWPKDSDPILSNSGADSFVTILIVTGQLEGAN